MNELERAFNYIEEHGYRAANEEETLLQFTVSCLDKDPVTNEWLIERWGFKDNGLLGLVLEVGNIRIPWLDTQGIFLISYTEYTFNKGQFTAYMFSLGVT